MERTMAVPYIPGLFAAMIALLTFLASSSLGNLADGISDRPGDGLQSSEQGQAEPIALPRLVVQLHGHLLSVRVRNASWEEVLQEIARQTGVRIHVMGPLAGTLSQEFQALPLEQGLRRLFREANTLFLSVRGTEAGIAANTLTDVWLFPQEGQRAAGRQVLPPPTGPTTAEKQERLDSWRNTAEAIPSTEGGQPQGEPAGEEEQDERLRALRAFAQQGHTETLQQALFDPDQTVQATALALFAERDRQGVIDVLVDATQSPQPPMRVQALSLLHQTDQADERMVLSVLEEALADHDVTVKSYAIQALAERRGPEAIESLRQALRDPDVSIRRMVIESVAQREQGHTLLQEALSDEDAAVRSLATFWLQQTVSAGR
jgi:hypothetical protein